MRTTLFVTLIVIIAGICTSCHTESIIKLGMTEYEVTEIINSNSSNEVQQQTASLKFIDRYYRLPNGSHIFCGFNIKTSVLEKITYLGQHQEGLGVKWIEGLDWGNAVDLKEVDIANYR